MRGWRRLTWRPPCVARRTCRNGQLIGSRFAPLSRFWRAADGWVRTHANYPWHHDALLRTLGTGPDVDAVSAAIAERSALSVEADVVAAGGVAAAVRTVEQWCEHPQGQAVAEQPLIGAARIDGAAPRPRDPAELPASGLRVLDLTRVIAGPVATRSTSPRHPRAWLPPWCPGDGRPRH